jgi:hypothetical protein
MATHDYIISNASGAAVRADLNNALAAIATNNSSATEPTTTYAYQWWADTGSSPTVMKLRNAANSAWITLFQLDGEWSNIAFENGTAAAPSIYFKDSGTDTGFYSPGANQVGISTGGTSALVVDSSQRVGIGTTSPTRQLSLFASTAPVIQFINSTTGSTANDGTLLYQTSSNFIIENQEAGEIRFTINGSQRATIDSSGRLLLGVSSTSSNSSFIAQGYSGGSGPGIIRITTTESSPTTDGDLGYIVFGDSAHSDGLYIRGQRDGGTWSSSSKPSKLSFHTTPNGASTPTERMRIDQNGLIKTYSTGNGHTVNVSAGGGTSTFIYAGNRSSTDVQGSGGTTVYYVYSNGNVQNTNGSYTTLSDAKLKENIVDAHSQWNDLKAIQIRNWNFKEETGHETHRQIGPIAQELEEVCPGLVYETPDRDADGNETGEVTKGVNQSVLYMKAVKALQEAMERIEALEAKVAALEAS